MESAHGSGAPGGDFCRRVVHRRTELGLSQEDVAVRAGMDPGYVAYLEEHPPVLTRSALYRLALALRTSPDDLLGSASGLPPGAVVTAFPHHDLRVLSRSECEELISPGGIGRIAFGTGGVTAPTVLPVTYVWDGDGVLFRTTREGVISSHVEGPVSFQVDRIDETLSEGWSVLIAGRGRVVRDPDEEAVLRAGLPLATWVDREDGVHVRVTAIEITGRRLSGRSL
ncbi:helix-turn-helix domain-containing protein [Nocardiopsis lambiniae]|uniref:Pyridoxamine 5'-phosphate oxidase family protein n=1 Tax=Nocardiopsis lambiniae TaxID=3075539 RepID=A0ABU2M899_9ACTN|nr:pyridoxamine 5'-phosphate oxidase family protein [Nocardiopsis sp. DSM 44743]MDT0328385.1 pyridoxamine 5'-phosphate oxidase family protein [Nocardiopsis sp. DSM 44743]